MESTLLSPSGTRYPRTPLNEESVNVMRKMDALLSNKKPDAQDALKMPKIPDAKIPDSPNNDSQMHEDSRESTRRAELVPSKTRGDEDECREAREGDRGQ